MFKETKKLIINDIMELVKHCKRNDLKCYEQLERHGQPSYTSLELLEKTLMYRKKETLDKIREDILEEVIYIQ